MALYIPILIIVISNVFYHISAKSTPSDINAFASLTITYAVAALCSLVLFFITAKNTNIIAEYKHLNWSCFILGIVIVGLEVGFILMYKAGWNISVGQFVASTILAIILIFVGVILYKEVFTVKKVAGIIICLFGMWLINF